MPGGGAPRSRASGGQNEPSLLTLHGTVRGSRQSDLAFRVAGVLADLPVKEGTRVQRGEIVAQLQQSEFHIRLDAAEAFLDQARMSLDALRVEEKSDEELLRESQERVAAMKLTSARSEFDRFASLIPSGAASRSEYDAALTAYLVAQEDYKTALRLVESGRTSRKQDIELKRVSLRALEATVEEAKVQLEASALRAPYDGVVAQRFAEDGQPVAAGVAVIRLESVDSVEVVTVMSAAAVDSACSANAINMSAEVSSEPGRRYPVFIESIEKAFDSGTSSFPVHFALPHPIERGVVPGAAADVTISYRSTGAAGMPAHPRISTACGNY